MDVVCVYTCTSMKKKPCIWERWWGSWEVVACRMEEEGRKWWSYSSHVCYSKKVLLFIYFLVSYTINKCMYEYCLFTESVLWQEYENRKALNFIQDFSHEIMLNFFKQLFSMCCWNGHMFSVLTSTSMMLCIHWLGHVRATLYICDEIDFIMSMTFFWDDISLCSPV